MIRSIAFHPKAMNDINNNGRSSDLLLLRRLPGPSSNQWLIECRNTSPAKEPKLTATGIVPDLHRIPF